MNPLGQAPLEQPSREKQSKRGGVSSTEQTKSYISQLDYQRVDPLVLNAGQRADDASGQVG